MGASQNFFSDAVIAVLVANELRHRLIESVFGVSRKDSNPVTAVAVATLADGGARLLVAPALPSAAAFVIGVAAVREGAQAVAGEWSRSVPGVGALVAVTIVGVGAIPVLRGTRRSLDGARTVSRTVGRRLGLGRAA